ncbi:HEAT repeat domain-containing protein [Micromonospora sp. CPCC 205546]|uniref:HEAT repeat domain-containing protein n=1 Tax=Micromonospora sp. CPCC 205546 TaxID=3122397 RepID=UPI002FF12563
MDYERARAQALRSATGNFRRSLAMMRSRDPQAMEDGFGLLLDIARQHVQELLDTYGQEPDYRTRFLLLELIGEARSALAFEVLSTELWNEDEVFSYRAERGLRLLDTKEARRLLWQHRSNQARLPGSDPTR